MVFKSYPVNEIQVGVEDFLRRMSAEHTYKQSYYALDDKRVAFRRQFNPAVNIVGLQPYAALTAVDKVALGLVFLVQRFLFVAQINEQLILVHPVGEVGELFDHLVLSFVYSHFLINFVISFITYGQPS